MYVYISPPLPNANQVHCSCYLNGTVVGEGYVGQSVHVICTVVVSEASH